MTVSDLKTVMLLITSGCPYDKLEPQWVHIDLMEVKDKRISVVRAHGYN
jgi:hypothetical protein